MEAIYEHLTGHISTSKKESQEVAKIKKELFDALLDNSLARRQYLEQVDRVVRAIREVQV